MKAASNAKIQGLQAFDVATVLYFLALPAAAPLFFKGVTPRESVPLLIGLFVPTLLCGIWGIWKANREWLIGFDRLWCIAARVLGMWFCLFAIASVTLPMLSSCVAEGTLIDTPSGPRRIETLVAGDEVWTQAPTGKLQIGKIAVMQQHTVLSCLEFKFYDGSSLTITGEHPIMTDMGWRRADSLYVGDVVQTRNGRALILEVFKKSGVLRVYDLTVEGNSNFYAGGILVHNKTRPNMAPNNCQALADAQMIYQRTDWDGDGVLEYAQAISGDWSLLENKRGEGDVALIDRSFADAVGDPRKATPRHGYCFQLLTAQGTNAPGGAKSYIDEQGNMTGGYAFVAFPAKYGAHGMKLTFMISNTGVIYEADLGENTVERALEMKAFDPDPAIWK